MSEKKIKDLMILAKFIEVYCNGKHKSRDKKYWSDKEFQIQIKLCNECVTIMDYSANRLKFCPQNPKPTCKKCEVHCYAPNQRQKIREIMRYSGMELMKRGRLDYLEADDLQFKTYKMSPGS
jgi:hypothetical protein